MAFAAAAAVPLGLLFLSSGLVVNLFQAILFVLIYPFSKSTYREINKVIAELLWLEFVWLFDWWAGVKIELYGDPEAIRLMGKEHALFISNHRSDVDWLAGWILAERSGCLGSTLAVMKKSLKFLPVFGWSMWFSEYLFLERNWAKDEETIKSGLERLRDFPRPFWLALFVEGTRFTETKLLAAQEYAASAGLPIPRNVLIPRTKGFVSAVIHMRSFVPAIYEATVAIPNSQPFPTMLGLLKGIPSTIRLHIRRHAMEDLPDSEPELARWCRDAFLAKDDLLDLHTSADTFSGHTLHNIGRPVRSLAVVIGWCSVLVAVALKVLHACYVSSSWNGIIVTSVVLVIVTLLTHVLIAFSQSDRSSPHRRQH